MRHICLYGLNCLFCLPVPFGFGSCKNVTTREADGPDADACEGGSPERAACACAHLSTSNRGSQSKCFIPNALTLSHHAPFSAPATLLNSLFRRAAASFSIDVAVFPGPNIICQVPCRRR